MTHIDRGRPIRAGAATPDAVVGTASKLKLIEGEDIGSLGGCNTRRYALRFYTSYD